MKKPKSQKAFILKALIKGGISEQNSGFNGFRTRISELRRDITINTIRKTFITRFGKKSAYNHHYIATENITEAVNLYNKINQ